MDVKAYCGVITFPSQVKVAKVMDRIKGAAKKKIKVVMTQMICTFLIIESSSLLL